MLKKIKIIFMFITVIILSSSLINVKAMENDSYKISKEVSSYESANSDKGGDIIIKIENIELKDGYQYKYQLEFNNLKTTLYNIKDIDVNNKTLKFELDKTKQDILNILKITDKANLTIKEVKDNNDEKNIINQKLIDISLPLSKAFKVGHWQTGYHGISHTYGIDEIYYKYVKVENEEILKRYLEYLKDYKNHNDIYWGYYVDNLIDTLNLTKEMPKDGWKKLEKDTTTTQPTEEGLYFIWIKAPKTEKNKELVGCVFSKRFTNNNILEKQLKEVQDKKKLAEEKTEDIEKKNVKENKNLDKTLSKSKLPKTGTDNIFEIAFIGTIILIIIVSFIKYNKNKDIK